MVHASGWRRNNIVAKGHASSKISGAPIICNMFIGGCNIDSPTHYAELGITLRLCDSLLTKAMWCSAFEIDALETERETLLPVDLWPVDVFVRNFYIRPKVLRHYFDQKLFLL